MAFVEVDKLWVNYGDFLAVRDLSFQIPKGEVFGFIGPNGAGKSTTIKVLSTLLMPTSGSVFISGMNVCENPSAIRRRIGYMPDFFGLYEDLTVFEYLHFFAAAYKIPFKQRSSVLHDVLELTDLGEKYYEQVDSLSRGMKQRLGIARILLHDPDFLLLDEPASGLDPRARIEMRELLRELMNMGKTILISSHILHELSHLATHIGIIEAGGLIAEGPLTEIYKKLDLKRTIHLQLANADEEILQKIEKIDGVNEIEEDLDRIRIGIREDILSIEDLHDEICRMGGRIRMYQPEQMDMETVFMKLTEGRTA